MKLLAILVFINFILLQLIGLVIGKPTKETPIEYNVSFGYNGGEKELLVKTNSIVKIEIETNNPIGCSWSFVNEAEIKSSECIEFQDDSYKNSCTDPQMNGCDGLRTLSFYVRDASKPLPYLNLVCKRPQEEENFGEIMVTLYSDEQIENPFSNVITALFSDEGGEKEIFVNTNSYVELYLPSNPSTGYSWILINEDKFKTSETVTFIRTEYESSCSELVDGCGGVDKYIFLVKDAYGELPKIKFVYKRAWENKIFAEALVTLKPIIYPDQPTRLEFPISFDINGGKKSIISSTEFHSSC